MTPSGFMPNAAATSLGSMVLTRSASRVQRSMRGGDVAGVQDVADIGGRRGCPPGLGALGDDHVRVAGALAAAVGQAALQHLPAGGVERHRVRALAEPDRPGADVDVTGLQVADLAAGGAVQQGEDAQQRLVRVGIGTGPAAEQGTLLVKGDGSPGEVSGCGGGQAAGRSARMILWVRA